MVYLLSTNRLNTETKNLKRNHYDDAIYFNTT